MTLRKLMYFDEWRNPKKAKAFTYSIGVVIASLGALAAIFYESIQPGIAAAGVAGVLFVAVTLLALFD